MICAMKSSLKIVWETKITFLLSITLLFFLEQKYSLFSETYFCKIPNNLFTSAFFCRGRYKKHRSVSDKNSNAALIRLADWIIKNDHVINCAMFFCKWFKHGQTSNVFWLQLEVAHKKPLFTTKPASIWIQISW